MRYLNQLFLNELHINSCKIRPFDLILQLTVLESLSHLSLTNLTTLSDTAFIADSHNMFLRNESDTTPLMGPGIACFKSLKLLHLRRLPLIIVLSMELPNVYL